MVNQSIAGLVFSGLILMMGTAMANNNSTARSDPPRQYQLADVTISILHQTGHKLPGSYRIVVSGSGKGTHKGDEYGEKAFILKKEMLVEILNDLYRSHFFELSDTWTVEKRVALLADDSIVTSPRRLVDKSSKKFCIEIGDFKKCVTIVDSRPVEVGNVIEKIEGFAFLDQS